MNGEGCRAAGDDKKRGGWSLERVGEKACETDGKVVKEEVRYSIRPSNPRKFRVHECTRRNRARPWVLRTDLGGKDPTGQGRKLLVIQYLSW